MLRDFWGEWADVCPAAESGLCPLPTSQWQAGFYDKDGIVSFVVTNLNFYHTLFVLSLLASSPFLTNQKRHQNAFKPMC